MRFSLSRFLATALLCTAGASFAQTAPLQVSGAWARATVTGQGGSGAYMTLTATQDLQLVGIATAAAGVAQVHDMKLDGNTMRMHAIPALALPAHQSVTLAPGGKHLMLMDLKQVLTAGSTLQIELKLKDAAGQALTQTVDVPVRQNAPDGAAPAAAHGHHGS